MRLVEAGLARRIDRRMARDATRSLSVLARRAGVSGILLLLDEAERILAQTRSVRNNCYGVIRDLLDNADDQGGMDTSIIYVAATPDMFQSDRGFPEYDALRSRLATSARFSVPGLVDWRGVIVDLTAAPLPRDLRLDLVRRVVSVHSRARDWSPQAHIPDEAFARLVSTVQAGAFAVSKLRLLTACAATFLEIVEQHRDQPATDLLDATISTVHASLARNPTIPQWE